MKDSDETAVGQHDDERPEATPMYRAADTGPDPEATLASDTGPLVDDRKPDEDSESTISQDGDPEQTVVHNDFSQTLKTFTEALATGQQDLDKTLPTTSLRPVFSSPASGTQTVSVRPRDIQAEADASSSETSKRNEDLDYLTLQMLGQGGRGTVHLARQVALGRLVALKQIQVKHRQHQSVKDEFLTEAVLTGKLEHPNIVPIYEVGKSPDGDLFYSMKNIKGSDWHQTIGNLSLDENLDILINVCDAIAFAHAEGVIHRDLKPQNIMTGGFGEVLVLDWGLAVVVGSDGEVSDSAAGTPAYMAPEMVNPPFTVGPRSDIYLLGAILFKILTGSSPHPGQSGRESLEAASKNKIVSPDEDRVRKLDPSGELLALAYRAMATLPQDRFQTVAEFQQAIRDFLSHRDSLELSSRAQASLESAESTHDYTDYSRTVFGFEEALKLWDGNAAAGDGVPTARLAWALCAEEKGDFDLSLSLLDDTTDERQQIRARVTAARDERDARQHRIRRLQRVSLATSLAVAVVASVAAVWINTERTKAQIAQQEEATQREFALKAKALAEKRADEAKRNLKTAERNAYNSDMLLIQRDWDAANLDGIAARLKRQSNRDDLRGFEWGYWARLVNSEFMTLGGHSNAVLCVAFSSDGTRVASAGRDNTVKLWDVATGREIFTFDGHTDQCWGVAFSPDGTRVASASRDLTVRVWDTSTGKESLTLTGHKAWVLGVAFSPDGRQLASSSGDDTVKLWDTTTGQEIRTLKGHRDKVWRVAFSPDGARLASASSDKTVKVWDVATGKEEFTLQGHSAAVRSIAFSPDGTRLVSSSEDQTVRVWDVNVRRDLLTFTGHTGEVYQAAISPDGRRVASASQDNTVMMWDVATGQQTLTLRGHTDRVYSVAFSPDGTRLATSSVDKTVKIWDAVTGQETPTLKRHIAWVWGIAFSPDGKRLASAGSDMTVKVWDVAAQQVTLTLTGHTDRVFAVAFSPDGKRLATGGYDNSVRLWNADTGQQTLQLDGHSRRVNSVVFSPDGTRLASASGHQHIPGEAKIWDAATGQVLLTLKGHEDRVNSVSFSPDGTRLATASFDNTVKVWNASTGQELLTLNVLDSSDQVSSVCFSPDGKRLAGGTYRKVRVWDATTGEETHILSGHTTWVRSVAFSPDGTRLASGSIDQTLKVWDSATGQEVFTLDGHTGDVWAVSFSPDGTRLASGSFDGTVKLWDARPWTPRLRAEPQARRLLTVLRDRVDSLEELRGHIDADRTINEVVRKQALDWAELFWNNGSGQLRGLRPTEDDSLRISSDGLPELVAHRGASYHAPENTLAAFELAWKQGADAVEGDFRLTKDGHIVAMHDATTKRTTDVDLVVADSTLEQLSELDAGSWKSPEFADEKIPLLSEVLATIPAGKKLFLEIKCGPEIVPRLEQELADGSVSAEQIVVIAFNQRVIAELKRRLPEIRAHWDGAFSMAQK